MNLQWQVMTQNPNLAKSEIYNFLRDSWKTEDSPKSIIERLEKYQNAFLDISTGSNLQKHGRETANAFKRLFEIGLPAASYPFLMSLSEAIRENAVTDLRQIGELLACTESFLVRRAVVGFEPTGLHSVFKKLWSDLDGDFTVDRLQVEIRKHGTVQWPTNSDFGEAVASRNLYGSAITPFLVRQFDRSLGGDVPVDKNQIEHVLPTTLSDHWKRHFSEAEHSEHKDRLANLLPLSQTMNASLSNDDYFRKRQRYEHDSMFKSTRDFAAQHKYWNTQELSQRAKRLSDWAVDRWAY